MLRNVLKALAAIFIAILFVFVPTMTAQAEETELPEGSVMTARPNDPSLDPNPQGYAPLGGGHNAPAPLPEPGTCPPTNPCEGTVDSPQSDKTREELIIEYMFILKERQDTLIDLAVYTGDVVVKTIWILCGLLVLIVIRWGLKRDEAATTALK